MLITRNFEVSRLQNYFTSLSACVNVKSIPPHVDLILKIHDYTFLFTKIKLNLAVYNLNYDLIICHSSFLNLATLRTCTHSTISSMPSLQIDDINWPLTPNGSTPLLIIDPMPSLFKPLDRLAQPLTRITITIYPNWSLLRSPISMPLCPGLFSVMEILLRWLNCHLIPTDIAWNTNQLITVSKLSLSPIGGEGKEKKRKERENEKKIQQIQ